MRFVEDSPIDGPRVIICGLGSVQFGVTDQWRLRRPAAVNRVEAPACASLTCANGRAVKLDKDGIGVGGRKNANRDPARPLRLVLEFHVFDSTVGLDQLFVHGVAVDD